MAESAGDGFVDYLLDRDQQEAEDASRTGAGMKDTNPKDPIGSKKWRQYAVVPFTIIWELGVAMLEGAIKYGRHNYRVAGVRGSVYVDAAKGHIDCWWEGEDDDPDSGLSHITKAMASLAVLRDAMIQGKFVDDRPPKTDIDAIRTRLQQKVDELVEKYPDPVPPYVEGDQYKDLVAPPMVNLTGSPIVVDPKDVHRALGFDVVSDD